MIVMTISVVINTSDRTVEIFILLRNECGKRIFLINTPHTAFTDSAGVLALFITE